MIHYVIKHNKLNLYVGRVSPDQTKDGLDLVADGALSFSCERIAAKGLQMYLWVASRGYYDDYSIVEEEYILI